MNSEIKPTVGVLYTVLLEHARPAFDFIRDDIVLVVNQYDCDFVYHVMPMVEMLNLRTQNISHFEWQPSWFKRLES